MKKSNNTNFVLEVFWLIVFILTLIMGCYSWITQGFANAYMFLIMAILSFLLYIARRTLRKRNARQPQ